MYKLLKGYTGFTLIELLVTIAVISVLIGIAIPNFTAIIQSNRLSTCANDLVTALNFARSEAIKRITRVTVTQNGGDWSKGWVIDVQDPLPATTTTMIRTQVNNYQSITVKSDANVAQYISFTATGESQLTNLGLQTGTIKFCDNRSGNVGINLTINPTGRVSTQNKVSCP